MPISSSRQSQYICVIVGNSSQREPPVILRNDHSQNMWPDHQLQLVRQSIEDMFELGVDESMDMHVDQLNEQGNQTIEVRERFADECLDNREEARQPMNVMAIHLYGRPI